jgi:hypothetical protein
MTKTQELALETLRALAAKSTDGTVNISYAIKGVRATSVPALFAANLIQVSRREESAPGWTDIYVTVN